MSIFLSSGQPFNTQELLNRWATIANWNSRIAKNPLTTDDILIASNIENLIKFINSRPYHPIGTAICIENVCFIQQSDDGDYWLTIKNKEPLDSFRLRPLIAIERIAQFIRRLIDLNDKLIETYNATDKERDLFFGDFPIQRTA